MADSLVHLIKLAVGIGSVQALIDFQQHTHARQKRQRTQAEFVHITRQTPKRAEALLAGGSLYWVIKGSVAARQIVMEIRPLQIEGISYCGLVLAPDIILTVPKPRRPFQGWRYLENADIPADLETHSQNDAPDEMLRELAELGLL
jgi:hypothetical protein